MDTEKFTPVPPKDTGQYRGLSRLVYIVRWSQHLLSVIAEVLILLSFAMSGMDVSLGGVMANDPQLKVIWAGMFALGIDTAFALSWVRVRRHWRRREWLAFIGNGLLALGMAFIVFQPIAIQLSMQSLNLTFNQALTSLGINMALLTYARSAVAVFLGAILALTNTADEEALPVRQVAVHQQRFAWLKRLGRRSTRQIGPQPKVPSTSNRAAQVQAAKTRVWEALLAELEQASTEQSIVTEEPTIEQTEVSDEIADTPTAPLVAVEQTVIEQVTPSEQLVETPDQLEEMPEQPSEAPAQVAEESAQPELPSYDTPKQRTQKVSELDLTGLSAPERIAAVLNLFPDLSDRELGKVSGMSAATAKKHRQALKAAQPIVPESEAI